MADNNSARVLITDPTHPVCTQLLEEAGFTPVVATGRTVDELKLLAAEADGWIIRSGTKITPELIDVAGRLKVIGRAGVGVDNVNIEAASNKGILVLNAPDGNTISTAEHTVAMLLALSRRIAAANASIRSGAWDRKSFMGSEIHRKTLGILGAGKVGRAVAERLRGFGMTILGYDPIVPAGIAEGSGIKLVEFEELISESDIITLHTPLNDATRGILNDETLARCRKGVVIVNCARGGIVDEAALLRALEAGIVGGAAVDVYSSEPPPPELAALIGHDRVVATPHIAASTHEAQEKVARQVTEQVIHALRNEPVETAINAGALTRG